MRPPSAPQFLGSRRLLPFAEVPDDARFWRRGDPVRWYRARAALVWNEESYDVQPPPTDELVLLDPQWCSGCKAELARGWPHTCPRCSAPQPSLDEQKRAIADFTGNVDPHI